MPITIRGLVARHARGFDMTVLYHNTRRLSEEVEKSCHAAYVSMDELRARRHPHAAYAIFASMMPFMGIQVLAMFLLYMWPSIGLWLPQLLYK